MEMEQGQDLLVDKLVEDKLDAEFGEGGFEQDSFTKGFVEDPLTEGFGEDLFGEEGFEEDHFEDQSFRDHEDLLGENTMADGRFATGRLMDSRMLDGRSIHEKRLTDVARIAHARMADRKSNPQMYFKKDSQHFYSGVFKNVYGVKLANGFIYKDNRAKVIDFIRENIDLSQFDYFLYQSHIDFEILMQDPIDDMNKLTLKSMDYIYMVRLVSYLYPNVDKIKSMFKLHGLSNQFMKEFVYFINNNDDNNNDKAIFNKEFIDECICRESTDIIANQQFKNSKNPLIVLNVPYDYHEDVKLIERLTWYLLLLKPELKNLNVLLLVW